MKLQLSPGSWEGTFIGTLRFMVNDIMEGEAPEAAAFDATVTIDDDGGQRLIKGRCHGFDGNTLVMRTRSTEVRIDQTYILAFDVAD